MPQTTFSDWSGGEFGELGPTGAKDNMWTGRNVMVYMDGSVGPRPGVKTINATASVGVMWALRGVGGGGPGQSNILFGQGGVIKTFLLNSVNVGGGTGATTVLGTVSITVTVTTQIVQAGPSTGLVPVYGGQTYLATAGVGVSPLVASPGAQVAALYGSRVVVANTPAQPTRVYYSNGVTTGALALVTFPALNFFDVGVANWPITHLDETRQRLTIASQGGDFWGLSGTPGVNDVLRRQPRGDLAPAKWQHTTRVGEAIWFLPFNEDFPVNFTGAVVDKLKYKYLRYTEGAAIEHYAVSIPALDCVVFYEVGSSNRAMMLYNDTWSYHTFGVGTQFATPLTVGGITEDYDDPILMSDGGGSAATPTFYAFRPSLNRPGKVSDIFAQPGDNSTTPLTANLSTRYWWAPNDKDIQVTEVTVDGFTWNTGSATANSVDVQVRSLFRYGDIPYADSTVQEFSQAASATTSDRQDTRFRATNPGAPYAQGFQVILTNLRGFAVRRIRVQYTETARR